MSEPPTSDAAGESSATEPVEAQVGEAGPGLPPPPPPPPTPRRRRRRRPHRTWPQRLLIAANIVLVMVCLSSAWALAFYNRQLSAIPRISMPGVLDQQSDPSKPLNFLLVGADSDEGLDPKDPVRIGRQGENSGDVIMILRVEPDASKARLLSLPRDLWVQLPGGRGRGRINSTLALATPPGNPELLIQTIQENFHIKINHYLGVNFAAFRSLVDALDGVDIWFDEPTRDENTGLAIDARGCRQLSGEDALRYARSRHYQQRMNGRWVEDPTSDFGRITRQQYFLKQAAKKAIARGARNPIELNSLLGVAQQHLRIDAGLTPQMILDVASHFTSFNPDDLQVMQPYIEGTVIGGAQVLKLLEAPSRPIFDQFRDVDLSALSPASVRVEVRNGTGRGNHARDLGRGLAGKGFPVVSTGDEYGYRGEGTVIRHAPGVEGTAAAVLVARHLDTDVTFETTTTLDSAAAAVVVVIGPSLAGVRLEPRPVEDFRDVLDRAAAPTPPGTVPGSGEPQPPAATSTTTTLPPPNAQAFVPHPEPGSGC